MKKIEVSNLNLLAAGEHVAVAFNGKILAVWTMPESKERRLKFMKELVALTEHPPYPDFFVVGLQETTKPRFFTRWYCVKVTGNEITHKAFSRRDYIALKSSLEDSTVFKII